MRTTNLVRVYTFAAAVLFRIYTYVIEMYIHKQSINYTYYIIDVDHERR